MPGSVAEDLHLQFPSRSGYLGISRLNATAVAASAGFNVEELDDLRLAVSEGMAWLLNGNIDGSTSLSISCRDRRFELTATVEGNQQAATSGSGLGSDVAESVEADDLVHAILGATTDHYEIEADGQKRTLLLHKHAADG